MKANINFKSRFKILKNGKISLILSALLGSVTITVAAPTGGKVTSGNATISQSGNITNINQASLKASINWQDFSIKQHETVNFKQPDVNSITLNRVVGNEKSIINGALNANGQVWILNSNGVLFGKNASINTSGIVASTLNMSDKDFNEGNYKFSGDSKNSIINEGRIDISNTGYASFFGQKVVNEGVIKATLGDVNLVSASEVTLNLNGNSTLSLTVNKGILDSLVDNNGAIYTKGGEVLLSANAVDTLVASVVNNEGIVEAQGFSEENGVIKLSGDIVVNNGTLNASGENGGDITTHAKLIIDNGISDVSAKTKAGNITQIADEINQTSKAILKADAKEVAGKILLNHKNIKDTSIYASGKMSAKGKAGGNIKISSETVKIVGAKLDSSGTQNAGEINLGGEWQGKNETIKNAKNTEILNSNITNNGKDAVVTVWSNEKTLYNSKIEAKNGNVEISSKGNLGFDGDVIAKNLLLDPKNITIKDINTYSLEKTIINPTGSLTNKFGLKTLVLDNGNFVVSTSGASISGIKSVGKIYMYDSSGALISTLSGSNTSDYVGTYGINLLSNGNFVIKSPLWNTHRGAVTWVDKNVGLSGVVSSANSLVGTTEYDNVGYTVTSLTNGNYVITSSNWDRGAIQNVGAVTWGNGTTGTVGEVSIANSLVGSTAYDSISNNNRKVTDLKNGKYVISSYYWDNGSIKDVGAVTLVDGTTAASGEITASNSLVGHAAYDYIGSNIHVLSNGNFLVSSVEWNNGSAFDAGAITWVNSSLPLIGTVNESNSLVGSSNMDYIGDTTVHELGNGNFVLTHKNWDNGSATNTGAITWVNGSKGISGVIGESNSLVGSSSNDKLNNVKVLNNGNYVVYSSSWDNGNIIDAGAVTWADGTVGIKGVVNQNNSLVGTTASDHVGMGITALNNGNYVIKSSNWNNGNVLKAGAVTWADGTTGIQGTINSSNSLIGQVNNDQVGLNGITALNNGSYIVNSSNWNNGNILKAGAVTWTDNMTGISGFVNSSNSLIGSSNNDYVGSNGITVLSNGNYIVNSSNWNNGSILKAGAVTWANSNTGIFGVINSSNSLIGINNNDQIGSNGITVLNNSNYVVNSSNWNNGSILKAGAVTWGNGNSGISGAVSSSNSLIGTSNNDQIGLNGITALNNGNYIVNSSNWNNGSILKAGAVTWGNGNSGALGVVSSLNSIIGINNNDSIGSKGITALSNGNYIVNSFINKGVATFLDGTTQTHGTINNSNSLYAENTNSLLSIKETIDGVLLIEKDSSVGGTIYKVNKNYNTTNSASNALFTSSPSANSIITTTSLKTLLDSGTAVTLQANNDISVDSDIIVNNTSGNGGDFTLEAGRNITFNSNIFTDNGNFTAIAGSANANSTYKDSGTPNISITNSASINAGTANIKLHSNGGNFINNSGSSTPFTSSLTSIYLDSFTNATLNNLVINSKRYNTTYDGGCLTANCILPTSGVNMLYSIAPKLTVSTIGFTTTYGDDINIGGAVLSGFVDGDFYLTAGISGTAVYDITGTKSSSGKYSTGTHDIKYVSGLISKYGYGFIDNTTDTNELTVNKKALSLSNIVASNKVYDGNTTASTSGTLVGVVSGDSLDKTITSSFSDKNAGNSKTVTIDSLVLSGLDKDNYSISSGQTTTANISKKALSLSNIVASNKVYDGNTDASTSGTLVGVVSGDNIGKTITSTFSNKNAGNSKTVTIDSLVLSGLDKDNYSISSGQTTTANISKKALSLSNIVASNKIYDGNTTASTSGTLVGVVSGDNIGKTITSSFSDKNAGNSKTVTIDSLVLSGLDKDNYSISSGQTTTANISKKALSLSNIVASNKVYDGNTDASTSGTLVGVVSGDNIGKTITSTFSNKNAGNSKTVTIDSLVLSGLDKDNYSISSGQTTTANISKKALSLSNIVASNKVYDGNTDASTSGTLVGVVSGDNIGKTTTSSFSDKNAGNSKTVTIDSLVLSGLDKDNYSISSGQTATADISKKALSLSNIVASNKVYDGNTDASTSGTLVGVVSGDNIGKTITSTFSNKNAGNSKTVTIDSLVLSGLDKDNYSISSGQTTTANISKKALSLSNIVASNKVYDGNTDASTSGTLVGVVSGDNIGKTTTSSFSDKNAGNSKTVTIDSLVLSGLDKDNYSISSGQTATADISKKALSLSNIVASNKVYDGNNTANTSASLVGVVSGDSIGKTITSSFSDKNAGNSKTVTIDSLVLSGLDKDNYSITSGQTSTANISKQQIRYKLGNIIFGREDNKNYKISDLFTSELIFGKEYSFMKEGTDYEFTNNGEVIKNLKKAGTYIVEVKMLNDNYSLSNNSKKGFFTLLASAESYREIVSGIRKPIEIKKIEIKINDSQNNYFEDTYFDKNNFDNNLSDKIKLPEDI